MIFGLGSLLFGTLFFFRLLPRLISLSFWLGSALITTGFGVLVVYVLSGISAP
jgi:hypothetical protein